MHLFCTPCPGCGWHAMAAAAVHHDCCAGCGLLWPMDDNLCLGLATWQLLLLVDRYIHLVVEVC
jgi:hypothetical protein